MYVFINEGFKSKNKMWDVDSIDMLNQKQMYCNRAMLPGIFLLLSTGNGTWEVPYFCSAEGMRAKLCHWRQAIQSYQWSIDDSPLVGLKDLMQMDKKPGGATIGS